MIEIYWSDLTKEKQQEILDVLGKTETMMYFLLPQFQIQRWTTASNRKCNERKERQWEER